MEGTPELARNLSRTMPPEANRRANSWVSTSIMSRPEELSQKTRTFARMCTSLIEEAEAIGWYEQRISLKKTPRPAPS